MTACAPNIKLGHVSLVDLDNTEMVHVRSTEYYVQLLGVDGAWCDAGLFRYSTHYRTRSMLSDLMAAGMRGPFRIVERAVSVVETVVEFDESQLEVEL